MKKEFLENLGLTEDQIRTIQNESGSEQDKQRKTLEAVKTELEQANAKIKERDGDIETLKTSIKDNETLRQKFEELQERHKLEAEKYRAEIEAKDKDAATNELFSGYKFASDLAREGAIASFKSKGFKLEDAKFIGGKEWLDELVKAQPSAFVTDEKIPSFSGPTQGSASVDKEPQTYSQMMKVLKTNPNTKFD